MQHCVGSVSIVIVVCTTCSRGGLVSPKGTLCHRRSGPDLRNLQADINLNDDYEIPFGPLASSNSAGQLCRYRTAGNLEIATTVSGMVN
jgi:hypothetical protein